MVLVLYDRARALALGELEQWVESQWWSEAQVEDVNKPTLALGWSTLVLLDLDIPHLGAVL